MGSKTDIVKGRIEEASGVLTGNDKLRNKGKRDQAVGRVKKTVEDAAMGGKTDIMKGRIEEASGVLTGNDKLRNKGRRDQAIGRVKEAAKKAVDKITKRMQE